MPHMTPEPTPPRRSLFAVWRWPRWTWCVVALLIPPAYLLLEPIGDYFLMRYAVFHPGSDWAWKLEETIDAPARWCAKHSAVIGAIRKYETELLWRTFGPLA